MFGKRFHLIDVQGISIGFDISWFFIAVLLTWSLAGGYFPFYYPGLEGKDYLFMGFIGMIGLFVSVILHELGHAITAKRFGLPISRITLFLFGGIAELKKDPTGPKAEFLVAVAGPVVSVLLAVFFGLSARFAENYQWPIQVFAVISYLAIINVIVVIFNLIPAFPLDGGRILRAFLWWMKGSLGWATKVSSFMGAAFGIGLIFLGILTIMSGNFITGLWWMILGLFLQQAASMSKTQYYVKAQLSGEKVEKYMVRDLETTTKDITVKEFIEKHVYRSYHHLYPVVEDGQLVGTISLDEVKALPREEWATARVKDILVPLDKIETLSPQTDVIEAFSLFKDSPSESLLVVENQQLVGLLSAADLSKIISMKLELEQG